MSNFDPGLDQIPERLSEKQASRSLISKWLVEVFVFVNNLGILKWYIALVDATFPQNSVNYLIILHFVDYLVNFIELYLLNFSI